MKKIIVYAFAVFLAVLFSACSSTANTNATEEKGITKIDWNAPNRPGFFQHEEHLYGFDRHPEPKRNKEDSIAYISIPENGAGLVKLKINTDYGDDFDICNPNDKSLIASIDTSEKEQSYEITGSREEIALCADGKRGKRIVQKLNVSSYDWKEYGFDVYTFGSSCMNDYRQPCNDNFWVRFDSVFRQAVVKHGEISKKLISFDKGYVLTRTEGKYGYDECAKGDIGEIMDDFFKKAANDEYNNLHSGTNLKVKKRAIIQIMYPTKRFWPLAEGIGDRIKICGEPKTLAPSSGLVLESLSKPGCDAVAERVDVLNVNGVWKLKYRNGNEVNADTSNADPKCMVFAEAGTSDYVGEIGEGNLAVAKPLTHEGQEINMGVSIALLPWSEEYRNSAAKGAIHELGHTMGLGDLNDKPLSCVPNKNAKPEPTTGEIEACIEGEENNLMHYTANSKEYKLRNRKIKSAYYNRQESQWKCLQRIDAKENCINQNAHLMD